MGKLKILTTYLFTALIMLLFSAVAFGQPAALSEGLDVVGIFKSILKLFGDWDTFGKWQLQVVGVIYILIAVW